MTRLALALIVLLCLVSVSTATLAPPREPLSPGGDLPSVLVKHLTPAPSTAAGRQHEEFVITDQTEITLNGRPCKYADVPASASILKMEVDADGKTILKVHFRTKK